MISAQATDPPELSRFRRSKPRAASSSPRTFEIRDHPLRIVVVKDMWLTGFDAPVLHTLYIDKPMRDHGLLQAIARVNRVFRDKPGGLVVDYIGIGEDLRASLRAYDDDRPRRPGDPRGEGGRRALGEQYEVLCALLYPAGYRQGELAPRSRPGSDCSATPTTTSSRGEERAREFLDAQTALASWYALVAHPAGGDRAA